MENTDLTFSASLKLAEMVIERLSLRNDIVLICLTIKLLFLIIQKSGNGKENKETQSVEEVATDQLLKKLESKLQVEFYHRMQQYFQQEPLLRELQVQFELICCFIIWPCLKRTGNNQIHEFDWLKWILTAV